MEQNLSVQLAWSPEMHGGQFNGKQPEYIMKEQWLLIDRLLRPAR
jgi:hypothetical protein